MDEEFANVLSQYTNLRKMHYGNNEQFHQYYLGQEWDGLDRFAVKKE
jgi:hypothetical protein